MTQLSNVDLRHFGCLVVKNKFFFVDETCPHESIIEPLEQHCDKYNAVVKAWIINSIYKDLVHRTHYNPTAHSIWNDLREQVSKVDHTRIFYLHPEIFK